MKKRIGGEDELASTNGSRGGGPALIRSVLKRRPGFKRWIARVGRGVLTAPSFHANHRLNYSGASPGALETARPTCRFTGRLGRVMAALLFLAGEWGWGGECLQWIRRTDVGSYGQRMHHAMAYDPHRGVTVFFGGEIGQPGEETYFDDTQEYDGKTWKQINTAVKPPVRSLHAMVYDPVRSNIVMFGGINKSGPYIQLSDTWVYTGDGVNGFWKKIPDSTPLSSAGLGMIWDSTSKNVVIHGGSQFAFENDNETGVNQTTYVWNGTNWFNILAGPRLWGFGMAFDAERATAMIVGGFTRNDESGIEEKVWERTAGGSWEDRGPGPPRRGFPAIAYDERRKRVVLVGGVGDSVETGESAYEYISGRGWLTLPSLPSGQGRAGAKMVYDSKRGVMVLTGGAGGGAPNAGSGGRYSDTWELWPSLFIGGQPLDATNEVCTTATLSAGVQGNPPLQFTWRRDGAPLAADERYVGVGTPQLRILSVRHADAGKYELEVRDSCDPPNVVTSRVATLTTRPESEWVFRTTNGPSPRFGHGMVYDSQRRVTVLFGGRTNHNFTFPFGDLWEWNGAKWTQRIADSVSNGWVFVPNLGWRLAITNGPVRRAHFAMAYDSRRGRVIIFGGQGRTPDGSGPTLRDLWEWDGTQWHFRTTNGPVGRFNGSMVYDERRGRTVLFGGQSVESGSPADTHLVWEWDGNRWYTNQPVLPPTGFYTGFARMTYDSFRGVSVFGPIQDAYGLWSFYDWDGVKWTNPAPVTYLSDPVLSAMNGTFQGAFAFDGDRRRSVWFGGYQSAPQRRTALFDGKRWTLLTNSPPPARGELAMAYDSDRRVTVMFGGSLVTAGTTGETNDTWELAAVDAPVIHEHPTSQIRLAGETATFRVSATGHGFVAYQWYFQNNLVAGAQTATLTIASVREADAGEYYVRVGSQCGSVTSRVATLTLNRNLQLYSSPGTFSLLWAPVTNATNVFLETADDVTGPWTIVPNPTIPFPINPVGPAKFYRYRKPE